MYFENREDELDELYFKIEDELGKGMADQFDMCVQYADGLWFEGDTPEEAFSNVANTPNCSILMNRLDALSCSSLKGEVRKFLKDCMLED